MTERVVAGERPTEAEAPGDELAWLTGILYPGGDGPRPVRGRRRFQKETAGARFLPLPSATRPRLLIPLGSRPASAAVMRHHAAAVPWAFRLVPVGASAALRAGVLQPFLPAVEMVASGGGGGSLVGYLERTLGRAPLALGVSAGPRRANRKPVLQIVDSRGNTVGYAKIGWNAVTRELVANEARALQLVADAAPQGFVAPAPLSIDEWRGLTVLVVSVLPERSTSGGGRPVEAPLAVATEIAHLQGIRDHRLVDSPYWKRLVADLGTDGDGRRDRLVAGGLAAVGERYGQEWVAFGLWHGDFSPWNMSLQEAGLLLWDWEFSDADVPVGFDVLHFVFQTTFIRDGASAGDALLRARRSADDLPRAGEAIWWLYVLELERRYRRWEDHGGRPSAVRAGIERILEEEL